MVADGTGPDWLANLGRSHSPAVDVFLLIGWWLVANFMVNRSLNLHLVHCRLYSLNLPNDGPVLGVLDPAHDADGLSDLFAVFSEVTSWNHKYNVREINRQYLRNTEYWGLTSTYNFVPGWGPKSCTCIKRWLVLSFSIVIRKIVIHG